MNWLLSFLIALLGSILGAVGGGFIGNLFASWFRISGRDGAAGYYVILAILLGFVGGGIISLICARVLAGGTDPHFGKALGIALGSTAAALVLVLGVGRLGANFPPRIGDRELFLDVEVRFPPAIPLPPLNASDLYRWHVTLTAFNAGRDQTSGALQIKQAQKVDDQFVVPATVYIRTTDSQRSLGVGCGDHGGQFFSMPLPARPTKADCTWSAWLNSPHTMNRSPIPTDQAVAVRYRVRLETEEEAGVP